MPLPFLSYTLNGTTYAADPLTQGLGSVVLVTQKEDGQVFYRTKWQGEISFVGGDFRLFWKLAQATCCQVINVTLSRSGNNCGTTTHWKGAFNLSDLKFDTDAGLATLSTVPRPDDGYQTLLENWDKKVNWLTVTPLIAIYSANKYALYRRGRRLTHVLAGLVSLTLTGTRAESIMPALDSADISTFLDAEQNPVTRRANPFRECLCLQASDVVAPGKLTDPAPTYGFATIAETTLHEVVTDLQELLCLYPFIDPDTGKLRWEHETYFPGLSYDAPTVGLSLPTTNPAWNGKRTVQTNTDALYGLYRLSIEPNINIGSGNTVDLRGRNIFSTTPDFGTGSIEFVDPCVKRLPGETPLTKERSVKIFATDIGGAQAWPDTVDKASWIFLVENPAFTVIVAPGTPSAIPLRLTEMANGQYENGNLSASSLVRDFHRHNQPFTSGVMNKHLALLPAGYRRGMKSIAPVRTLGSVTIAYCCEDTPVSLSSLIETWLGMDGTLIKATQQVGAELLTLDIAHPGPCQVIRDDTPYDPEEMPSTCPPAGEPLRETWEYIYFPGESAETGAQPCSVNKGTYYTDGKCGEYSTNDVISNGGCT